MNKTIEILKNILKYFRQGQASNGCVFISGAQTVTGNFSGLSVGSAKPDTINLTVTSSRYKLNASYLQTDDDIVDFVTEGQYLPIEFTSITTTGTGYIVAYKK